MTCGARTIVARFCYTALLLLGLAGYHAQAAQTTDPLADAHRAAQPAGPGDLQSDPGFQRTVAVDVIGPLVPEPVLFQSLAPSTGGSTMTWVAVVLLLALLVQPRPILSWRNADAVALALTALLLPLRDRLGILAAGENVRWWCYLLLTLLMLYWVVRGLTLFSARHVAPAEANATHRALGVVTLAGVALAAGHIAFAPLASGSRDGIIGGLYTAQTGRLPYGDVGMHDARSPLLYLLHAGAVKLLPPSLPDNLPQPATAVAGQTCLWDEEAAWQDSAFPAARLVNAALFVALLMGVAGLGHRLHSVALGATLCAVLCVFPGMLECTTRPEVLLPAALLTWTAAFVNVPVVGSFLATLTCLLAGLAWPWAWLLLPALWGYYATKGWAAFGMVMGKVAGAALILAIVCGLTAPALPRPDGALRLAGIDPEFSATAGGEQALLIERYTPPQPALANFKSSLWRQVLHADPVRLSSAPQPLALPNGVAAEQVRIWSVAAGGSERRALQAGYRAELDRGTQWQRWLAAARTVVEQTYAPAVTPAEPRIGMWEVWTGGAGNSESWTWIRRGVKLAVGLLALALGIALWRREPTERRHLLGALLAVVAAALIATPLGAAGNLALILPLILAVAATRSESTVVVPAAVTPPEIAARLATAGAPNPRITVNP